MNIYYEVLTDLTRRRDVLNAAIRALDELRTVYDVDTAFNSVTPTPAVPAAEPVPPVLVEPPGPYVVDGRQPSPPRVNGPKRQHGTGTIVRRGVGERAKWHIRYIDFRTKKYVEQAVSADYEEAERLLDGKVLERDKWRAERATDALMKSKGAGAKPGAVIEVDPKELFKSPQPTPIVTKPAADRAAPLANGTAAKKKDHEQKSKGNEKCHRGTCTHTREQHCKPGDAGPVRCVGCWCFEFVERAK